METIGVGASADGPAPSTSATPATTEIQLREDMHPALALLLQQLQVAQAWAGENVVTPLSKKAVEVKEQVNVALEPHIAKIKADVEPHIAAFLKFIEPYVEQAKIFLETSKEKLLECKTQCEPYIVEVKTAAEPYVKAAAEKFNELASQAGEELGKQGKLIKQKSEVWIDDRKREGQQWVTSQQTAISKAMELQAKMTTQVWEGAVAGAKSAQQSASELKSVREKEFEVQKALKEFLKAENYEGAKFAKAAEAKLHDLGERAEAAILAKVDAINREDFAAAQVHRKTLDEIAVEAEAAMNTIPSMGAEGAAEDGLASSVASNVVEIAVANHTATPVMANVD